MNKRKSISIMMCLITLLTLVISGCSIFPEEEGQLEPPIVLPKEISYRTKEATVGDIQRTTNVAGEVVPIEIEYQYITLKGSRLEEVLVNLGQNVEAGEPILKFISNDLEYQIETAEMRLGMSEGDYNTSMQVAEINGVLDTLSLDGLDDDLADLTEELDEMKTDQIDFYLDQIADIESAYHEIKRSYDLLIMQKELALYLEDYYNSDVQQDERVEISEMDLANTEIRYGEEIQSIIEDLEDMEETLEEYESEIDEDNQEQITALENSIEQQQLMAQQNLLNRINGLNMMRTNLLLERMALQEMYDDLDESIMNAEISGDIVYIRQMEEGDYINDYDKLIGIADESDYQVEYTGSNASEFNLGMEVIIKVNELEYLATVALTVDSVPEEEKSEYRDVVMFAFDVLPDDIRRGTNVSIVAVQEEAENIILIPKTALFYSFDDVIVYVLEDGVKKERFVEVGIESATEVEIINGIEEGDLIILN